MPNGKLLALLVVVVLCIAFTASPAMSASPVLSGGATTSPSIVSTGDSRDDNSTTTGDDDRWGEPGGGNPADELGTGESGDEGPGNNGKAIVTPGRPLLRFLFGSLFVL